MDAMSLETLTPLPQWLQQVCWSLIVILGTLLIGRIITRTICMRLTKWAEKTHWKWGELVIEALQRGIPFWSVLLGLYIAIGLWTLPPQLAHTASTALFVLGWISATYIAAGLVGKLIVLYGSQFASVLPVTSLTEQFAKILITLLGALMILNGMGVSITPILTALGVGGLAVALALQETLSNLFSGLHLTMARQVRVGDFVKLESGEEGYVEDFGWRATTIRTLPNNMVVVPNNKLASSLVMNYYLPNREIAVLVEVGVDYDSDMDQVERITTEVGREVMQTVPGSVPDFVPMIRYHTLGEYSINFTVVLRAKEFVDQYLVKHEFIKRLVARYRQERITIPFPTRRVLSEAVD